MFIKSLPVQERLRENIEVARIHLDNLKTELEALGMPPASTGSDSSQKEVAREILRLRRTRDQLFGTIFGEPAWDMLLELYVAEIEGESIPVSSVCAASAAPWGTALRHLAKLVEGGWVKRENDPKSNKRVLVSLTASGREHMRRFVERCQAQKGATVQALAAR